ncbi:Flavin mononucleotide phosphatase YigB [Marinomonas spartinae]|uniref:Flavin mononucleotide phosphatase YigB n=1 Tax=Marinomonas spartinae TaxID=1792290 RepID=A0A1A8TJJ5_9GAMM|nr:HAD-IA family hydrolase [Marinomonas spartinae]SBS33023.1 Flavin mononucleotide phosphatase YigB [Marinomonas spartinae]
MKKLVAFDLDNTLWDVDPVIVRAEYAMESWFTERFPGFMSLFTASNRLGIRNALIAQTPSLAFDITSLRCETYKQALKQFGLSSEESAVVAESAMTVFSEWRQKVDLYPHVKNVLEVLRQDYQLVAISNGNADVYHPYIGLASYFDFAIRADQIGAAKPDPILFETALKKAEVDYTQMVHIGDHPVDDVSGAAAAGVKAIWFNRHGARRWDESWGVRADAEVHSLLELPDVIRSLLQ